MDLGGAHATFPCSEACDGDGLRSALKFNLCTVKHSASVAYAADDTATRYTYLVLCIRRGREGGGAKWTAMRAKTTHIARLFILSTMIRKIVTENRDCEVHMPMFLATLPKPYLQCSATTTPRILLIKCRHAQCNHAPNGEKSSLGITVAWADHTCPFPGRQSTAQCHYNLWFSPLFIP